MRKFIEIQNNIIESEQIIAIQTGDGYNPFTCKTFYTIKIILQDKRDINLSFSTEEKRDLAYIEIKKQILTE